MHILQIPKTYFSYNNDIQNKKIPILTGSVAESFIQNAEKSEKHPRPLKLKVSFAQIDEMEARKHSYLKEHNGKNPFSV